MGADLWIEAIGFKATDDNQIDQAWARRALAWARQAVEDNTFARLLLCAQTGRVEETP